jgi:tRNA (guanine37-N1)-methyltransferase
MIYEDMQFEIVTIFPGFFAGIFDNGILRRALAEELVSIGVHDLRAFTHDRHRTVDDRPFGGGEGMVLKPEPLAEALASLGIGPKVERLAPQQVEGDMKVAISQDLRKETDCGNDRYVPDLGCKSYQGTTSVVPQSDQSESGALAPAEEFDAEGDGGFNPRTEHADSMRALAPEENPSGESKSRVILLSAQGRPFNQAMARELATLDRIVLICGRYEGVDERINQLYCDMELSIGDYVISGGELAAAVVVDATMRLIPGVLGNEASGEFESFGVADAEITTAEDGVPRSQHGAGGLLDYPHYTRPAEFGGLRAPEVLMNGDHAGIRCWRREQQLRKTLTNRPDLLQGATLSKEDRKLLEAIRDEAV